MKPHFISHLGRIAGVTLAVSLSQAASAQMPDPPADPNHGRDYVAERAAVEQAWQLLDLKWSDWINQAPDKAGITPQLPSRTQTPGALLPKGLGDEAKLPPPQRPYLAKSSMNGYYEPAELHPQDGTLNATLNVTYGWNYIGKDRVKLRSYNGQLVGPTLRARPGDVLRITVRNTLPTQPWQANSMNKLHDFNTTNLHTHGLHVSPNGISDNVLLEIKPGATQEYVIEIPRDHPCGTFWYHPHHHGSTAANVASGMSGALIIEGGLDDLPAIKAAKERVMVLNQILYVNRIPGNTPSDPVVELPVGVIEEEYAGLNMGPGDATTLGRFTTINGVQLPVIRMRPGQIERWRLIDSSQSEIIQLQLVDAKTLKKVIPFHEIAVDGLARGKAVTQEFIQMLPGYRSDVLVQVPQAGEYFLVDMAKLGMKANQVPLQFVARVIVEGERVTGMQMPTDAEMVGLRLDSLVDATPDGSQTASYGIFPVPPPGKGARFLIDNQSFDLDEARELRLGTIDEWKVSVKNGGTINTGHPFHIHVNPFEVTSIMGPQDPADPSSPQVEHLRDGPVWRDTIWVPNNGTVTFRTKYEEFIGTFVQHCHILDHEDQGMMQLIDIVDPKNATASVSPPTHVPTPGSLVPDVEMMDMEGKVHRLSDRVAGRMIVFLFKGHGCLHCAEQVQAFSAIHDQFKAKGIQVIGITSDSAEVLKAALAEAPSPFPIYADPESRVFAAFGCCRSGGLLHGTFFINEQGRIDWRTTGANPYLGVTQLLEGPPAKTTASAKVQ